MQRLVPAFALCLFLSFNFSTQAQQIQTTADDTSAVRATVVNYIEAYYTGDARRMEQTLHPHYLKHMIHGDIPMREKTAAEMVQEVRMNGVPDIPQALRTEQVSVLDVAGTIASAKARYAGMGGLCDSVEIRRRMENPVDRSAHRQLEKMQIRTGKTLVSLAGVLPGCCFSS